MKKKYAIINIRLSNEVKIKNPKMIINGNKSIITFNYEKTKLLSSS
jgi:hypothetical protein